MSFISVVATENLITVMSDGMESQKVNGKIEEVSPNYKKFKKISEKQFIAYAGNTGICTYIANKYKFKYEVYNLEEVAFEIQKELLQFPRNETKNQFIIGGVQNGEVLCYTVKNDEGLPELVKPEKKKGSQIDIKLTTLSSNYLKKKIERNLTKSFETFFKKNNNQVLHAQLMLNNLVAENDPTVNTNTRHIVIEI
ncbi:hypothetical protein [Bacillus sp. B3-WWTP-C-10-D-3]|uniref:hypothetical protein n=1 Tax=Bacillus sp. B3-WWTP-C-10-D-3 TaxID=2653217 RepID=UPI001261DBE4|nr:hypothetical protein [Bacillus sp. B3-WWTP-C-10-D-3]KAB7635268.1 hypothetical protein GBN83_24840 [Bacillus sp. B3-WWTP-C-10-D-3]